MSVDVRWGRVTRRDLLASAAGALAAAAAPRWVLAGDPIDDGSAALEALVGGFAKARALPRGGKEAQEVLRPLLKAHAGIARAATVTGLDGEVPAEAARTGSAWNDVVTLAHYHGVAARETYAGRVRSVAFRNLTVTLPVSPRWRVSYPGQDQLSATIEQQHLGKDPARTIKVWRYRWDTVYSGVGGENAQKLAEVMLESDRAYMDVGKREVSKKVEVRRLNKTFPRAYHYVVRGHDDDFKGEVRRRNWYVKGKTFTVNFEVIERLAPGLDEDGVTTWHREGPCPEVAFALESIAPAPAD